MGLTAKTKERQKRINRKRQIKALYWGKLDRVCAAVETIHLLEFGSIKRSVGDTTDKPSEYRFIVFWVGLNISKVPLCEIKRYFGYKSHGTIINGINRIDQWQTVSPSLLRRVEEVRNTLNNLPHQKVTEVTKTH